MSVLMFEHQTNNFSFKTLPKSFPCETVNSEAREYNNSIVSVDCIEEFSQAITDKIP